MPVKSANGDLIFSQVNRPSEFTNCRSSSSISLMPKNDERLFVSSNQSMYNTFSVTKIRAAAGSTARLPCHAYTIITADLDNNDSAITDVQWYRLTSNGLQRIIFLFESEMKLWRYINRNDNMYITNAQPEKDNDIYYCIAENLINGKLSSVVNLEIYFCNKLSRFDENACGYGYCELEINSIDNQPLVKCICEYGYSGLFCESKDDEYRIFEILFPSILVMLITVVLFAKLSELHKYQYSL
ncbi:Neural cell adhesion molecule 1-A [Trichinella spiralis]|uniref:Neural cell adhesion molecule 1-A n=1 Tax=Trichinella spiralis TaxID=6334 RepID=A0ABR3K7A1_TRISP